MCKTGFLRFFNLGLVVILTLGAVFTLPGGVVQAADTLDVCETCTYANIQAAITAAVSGDVIYVHDGVYTTAPFTINKNDITIEGQSEAGTIIEWNQVTTTVNNFVNVTGTGVILRNLTFDVKIPQYTADTPWAEIVRPNYGLNVSTQASNNLLIENVTVMRAGKSGFNLNGIRDVVLNNVTSQDNGGAGFFMTNGVNVTFNSIHTQNNQWGGIAIGIADRFTTPPATNGVQFLGTNTFMESNSFQGGVFFEKDFSDPLTVADLTFGINDPTADVNLQPGDFVYALNGPQDDGLWRVRLYQTEAQVAATAIQPDDTAHIVGPGHFLLEGRTVQNLETGQFHVYEGMSIQAAVDAASDGDVVLVNSGTYQEQVIINKSLELIGENSPIVIAPDVVEGFTIPGSTKIHEPVIFAFGGSSDASNVISGDEVISVNISGLVVDGNDRSPSGRSYGILYRNSNGTISENTVQKMLIGDKETFGILVTGDSEVDIVGNNVSGYARGGISGNGDRGDLLDPVVTIKENVVSGPGNVEVVWAPNGIQIGWGATGVIELNTVTGNGWPGEDWSGTGIILVATENSIIRNNDVSYNETGISVVGYDGPYDLAKDNLVSENHVYNNEYGVSIQDTCQNTTITGNSIFQSVYDGIDVFHYYGSYPVSTLINNNKIYENNTSTEEGSGNIWVEDGVETVNADSNWWGSISGPTDSTIFGDVNYAPWCGDEACTFLVQAGGVIDLSAGATPEEVQDYIDLAAPGMTIILPTGTISPVGGFTLSNPGVTVQFSNGTVLTPNSPCFTVAADGVSIIAPVGQSICQPSSGSPGINVPGAVDDLTISGLEIDGSLGSSDGIVLGGAVNNLRILDNYIHHMVGDGIYYAPTAFVTGVHEVQGNLFMENGHVGVNNASGVLYDLTYNSWGHADAPIEGAGFDYSGALTAEPYTHLALGFDSGDTAVADSVVLNEEITFNVLADARKLSGGDVGLTFDPAYLLVTDIAYNVVDFRYMSEENCIDEPDAANAAGRIDFCGFTLGDVGLTGEYILFTVTFQAVQSGEVDLTFDTSEDLFTMPSQSASNNLYASVLDSKTVTIVALYTVSGTVDLQGRSNDSGVTMRLGTGSIWSHNYVTVSNNWKEYAFTGVAADTYPIYTDQVAGYLNVPLSLGKSVIVDGDETLEPLLLIAGDVVKGGTENKVDLYDASFIGYHYYQEGYGCRFEDCPDINNDGIVNIFDLVHVGNNYHKTSETVYADWLNP